LIELHTPGELRDHLARHGHLEQTVLQHIDLRLFEAQLKTTAVDGAVFLGCNLSPEGGYALTQRGAVIFPNMPELVFRPYRAFLYTAEELFEGFDPDDPCSYCQTPDNKIYQHWLANGRANPAKVMEGMLRRIHDQSMTDALEEFLRRQQGKIVAIMGGHGMKRWEDTYRDLAIISRTLTRQGCLMVSGGGPGAMEATHLGAWFAEFDDDALEQAISHLASAPDYQDKLWLSKAFQVRERWPKPPDTGLSLAIPTWLYGHEPPNPFASHIAKYFNNSLREDGLVTVAHDGIVFAPGSAGTLQEIFQDACQNHYATTGFASPMIFLGRTFWTQTQPAYPLLEALAKDRPYNQRLFLCDSHQEVLDILGKGGPQKVDRTHWSFCEAYCFHQEESD